MSDGDTSAGGRERFGPADVTCPYCGEKFSVEAGPTKLAEVTHCNDRWIIVDLEAGKAGHTSKKALTDGGTSGSERESETNWPNETPILARLIEQMGESWPHFRITEHIDQHERSYTLIEWGDADTNFDPTAPNDFVSFVENRPEPTEKQITGSEHGGDAR